MNKPMTLLSDAELDLVTGGGGGPSLNNGGQEPHPSDNAICNPNAFNGNGENAFHPDTCGCN